MLLDLKYGVIGQVSFNFGNDPLLHIGVERKPRISQRGGATTTSTFASRSRTDTSTGMATEIIGTPYFRRVSDHALCGFRSA